MLIKVSWPDLVSIFNEHLNLSGVWLGVDLRTETKKIHVSKRLGPCLKYVNHSRLNSQHNQGGPI